MFVSGHLNEFSGRTKIEEVIHECSHEAKLAEERRVAVSSIKGKKWPVCANINLRSA